MLQSKYLGLAFPDSFFKMFDLILVSMDLLFSISYLDQYHS
jgi:hypothetical protein